MRTHFDPRLNDALGRYVRVTFRNGKTVEGVLHQQPTTYYYLENERGRYLFYKSNVRELKILK